MMKDDIRNYARLGLVHHLLYAETLEEPERHAETLEALAKRGDIETFDCCLPYDEQIRKKLIPIIRNCGKTDITHALHLFPIRKISLCTTSVNEQAQVRLVVQDMIEVAAAIGATGFIFASGGPRPDEATGAHYAAFRGFCEWLCAGLKPRGITALLEPFDTAVDKKFLYGSTKDCTALIESLKPGAGNMGIELDVAHLPLMGETFQEAIRTAAPYLRRVHLGNCVLKDRGHPQYGDMHPPIGLKGGEIDVPELAEFLRCLLDAGFLNKKTRGPLLLEMTPFPGKSAEETVADSMSRVEQAWERV